MRVALSEIEERYGKLKARYEALSASEAELIKRIDRAVMDGDQASDLSSELLSMQAEADAVFRGIEKLEDEIEEAKAFEKSDEAIALRKRLKVLTGEHEKRARDVVNSAKALKKEIDELFEILVEFDRVKKALGLNGNPSEAWYRSIKRDPRYGWIIRLRGELEKWLHDEIWLVNK